MALQACLRRELRLFLPGDEVEVEGKAGTIACLNEDRTCTITVPDGIALPTGVALGPSSSSSSSSPASHDAAAPVVRAVEVFAGALVDNIVFAFANGASKSYGAAGGSLAGRFELDEGETIVRVSGRSGDCLDAVQFHTSRGRSSQLFGNPNGGRPFDMPAPAGQYVVGVRRGSGGCCPAIRGLISLCGPRRFEGGQRVEVRGLSSAEGRMLNGRQGVVAHEQACQPGRVSVLLDGHVKAIKEDHLVLAPASGSQELRVLLQHCDLVQPRGNFTRRTRSEHVLELLSWSGRCELTAQGRGTVDGRPARDIGREGVHHMLHVQRSEPLPVGMMISSVEMEVRGMDQGWGNSGDSGVVLYVVRPGSERAAAAWDEQAPMLKVTYNRNVHSGYNHRAKADDLFGPFAPQPGDRLEATLQCPNFPGWNAWVERVTIRVHCVSEREEALPGSTPEHWQQDAGGAFQKLWQDLRDDSELAIDRSHMSIRGQMHHGVWKATPAMPSPSDMRPVAPRVRALCKVAPLHGAERLLEKLDQNQSVAGAPQDVEQRRARYGAMQALIHRTCDALEGKPELLETVCKHFGEAANDCVYRWDREIANMHDLVTGESTGADSRSAEDDVLRVLCTARRQMAESALHRAKGAASNSDMHFESYFYASIHFGLPEQVEATRDPNRLNYGSLGMLRPADVQRELLEAYSPAKIMEFVRSGILESKVSGAQAMREKLLDWFRANVPDGFRPGVSSAERQEAWLYEKCHDDGFRLRDEALRFLLCRMHVLNADRIACLAGDPDEVATATAGGSAAIPSSSRRPEGPCTRRRQGSGERAGCTAQ